MLDPKLQGYGGGFKELGSTENWKGNEISISTVDVPWKAPGPKNCSRGFGVVGVKRVPKYRVHHRVWLVCTRDKSQFLSPHFRFSLFASPHFLRKREGLSLPLRLKVDIWSYILLSKTIKVIVPWNCWWNKSLLPNQGRSFRKRSRLENPAFWQVSLSSIRQGWESFQVLSFLPSDPESKGDSYQPCQVWLCCGWGGVWLLGVVVNQTCTTWWGCFF